MKSAHANVQGVRQILDSSREWLDIDDLVKKKEAARLFPPELVTSAVSKAAKIHIRSALAKLRD